MKTTNGHSITKEPTAFEKAVWERGFALGLNRTETYFFYRLVHDTYGAFATWDADMARQMQTYARLVRDERNPEVSLGSIMGVNGPREEPVALPPSAPIHTAAVPKFEEEGITTYPAVLNWGGVMCSDNYTDRCMGCLRRDRPVMTIPILSERWAGEQLNSPVNYVRACDGCADMWGRAAEVEKQVLAILLRQRYVNPLVGTPFGGGWGNYGDDTYGEDPQIFKGLNEDQARILKRELVARRDQNMCRVCGAAGVAAPLDSDDTEPPHGLSWLVPAHILPQWVAGASDASSNRHSGWGVPREVTHGSHNVVAACWTCNARIGTALPPMPLAWHFMLKVWLPR